MFSCVWLHFKKIFGKYFLMFGCIFENTIENTFFTCCSHFLTFSQLPNKHVMSFIPKNSNKTQKDRYFLGEIAIAIARSVDRRSSGDRRDRNRGASVWVVPAQWRLDRAVCVWGARACERGEETIWSENNDWNQFQSFLAYFSVKLKMFLDWPNFTAQPNAQFSGNWFPKINFSQNKRSLNDKKKNLKSSISKKEIEKIENKIWN